MSLIATKIKGVVFSVLPIVIIVLLLHFTLVPLSTAQLISFLLGSLLLMLGLTLFLLGVDIGITPFGSLTGTAVAKSNKLWIVLIAGLILGFFISVAEPGLMVLAGQVSMVTSGLVPSHLLLIVVSVGLALLLALGFIRIFYNLPLYKLLLILYSIIFILALFTSREFLAISFDASGSTTGILAVPFILALSTGISKLKKDSISSEKDSFGLMAIASTGAIISVMLLSIFTRTSKFSTSLSVDNPSSQSVLSNYTSIFGQYFRESLIAILPLFIILILLQIFVFKFNQRKLHQLLMGFLYAFIGLFLFSLGVNGGFMSVGARLGSHLISLDNKSIIVIVAFIIGVVTILAEPAVHVLTQQIEDVTAGYVKKKLVLAPLALGVGLAIALSMLRVLIKPLQLWHYLLPGYIVALALMFIIPKLFVGIAFDAGGVATGPITATFILAFVQGAANAYTEADLLVDGFGMIAMVAMMPIITLELLGYVFGQKSSKKQTKVSTDNVTVNTVANISVSASDNIAVSASTNVFASTSTNIFASTSDNIAVSTSDNTINTHNQDMHKQVVHKQDTDDHDEHKQAADDHDEHKQVVHKQDIQIYDSNKQDTAVSHIIVNKINNEHTEQPKESTEENEPK